MSSARLYMDFFKGLWKENPVFRQLLGMCPTLAVTTSVLNGISMGLAMTFVLVSTSIVVSIIRKIIPNQVRIATFTIIIATFVTIADLFMKAKFPPISKALGPYVPLIVVNCIILGRQEAFAKKNPLHRSFLDALGMGVGFTLALILLGAIRELLGSGSILNFQILGSWYEPWVIMILPAGAFITLGFLVALINVIDQRLKKT
ncbi:MAG: electron transport complex subunit RsxE [Candidatus Cloacimonas sp. 4484_209]|nr:MAG: electron transport complex subunit RsxE [Candidatus Cloacimonas sp. 4484_209]